MPDNLGSYMELMAARAEHVPVQDRIERLTVARERLVSRGLAKWMLVHPHTGANCISGAVINSTPMDVWVVPRTRKESHLQIVVMDDLNRTLIMKASPYSCAIDFNNAPETGLNDMLDLIDETVIRLKGQL